MLWKLLIWSVLANIKSASHYCQLCNCKKCKLSAFFKHLSNQTTVKALLSLIFTQEKHIPEKAKNYTSCCKSNQRYTVSKSINCFHPHIEVDLYRKIHMQKRLTDMENCLWNDIIVHWIALKAKAWFSLFALQYMTRMLYLYSNTFCKATSQENWLQ